MQVRIWWDMEDSTINNTRQGSALITIRKEDMVAIISRKHVTAIFSSKEVTVFSHDQQVTNLSSKQVVVIVNTYAINTCCKLAGHLKGVPGLRTSTTTLV
jgi:hypothetical protein